MSVDVSRWWAIIAVVVSIITAALTEQKSIPLAPDLFTLLAGIFSAVFVQERIESRRRQRAEDRAMTKHIYGPLHKELSIIVKILKGFQFPSDSSLRNIINNWRFSLVEEKMSDRIEKIQQRLLPHETLGIEARRNSETHTGRVSVNHTIPKDVVFTILAAEIEIRFNLIDIIFQGKTPFDYMSERAKPYLNALVVVYIKNKSKGRLTKDHPIQKISEEILGHVGKDSAVQSYRNDRQYLIEECVKLIEMTRKNLVI